MTTRSGRAFSVSENKTAVQPSLARSNKAKKQRAKGAVARSGDSSSGTVTVGLTFGAAHKPLPSVLENLCCSFLRIDELADLYLASRGLSAQVVHYLGALQTLEAGFDFVATPVSVPLALVVRHCKSLTRINVRFAELDGPFSWETGSEHGNQSRFLKRTIANNQRTLQVLAGPDHLELGVLQTLVTCPQLRVFDAGPRKTLGVLDDAFVDAMKSARPPLHTLKLAVSDSLFGYSSWGVSGETVAAVLRIGRPCVCGVVLVCSLQ